MTTISENELAAQGIMYIARGRRKPPKGWVLAHNHVRDGKNTPNHMNGFSYFWLANPKAKGFSVCRCGWRPDWGKHYSGRPHQKILKRVPQVEKLEP
jgi:hypothetical protein